jgi:hypothetical protein
MSHFTTIKTNITDINALLKALQEQGFQSVEVHENAQPLYGYQGDIRPEKAEVIIRRKYVGNQSNDIGFQRQADGNFKAIISEYDRNKYSQDWLNSLTQRYGYHQLIMKAPSEGFTIEEEETIDDGTIRIVLGRWI